MLNNLTYDLIITLARYVGKGNAVVYATHHPKVLTELVAVREEVYELRRKMQELEMFAFQVADDIATPMEWRKRGFKCLPDVGKRAFSLYDRIRAINQEKIVPRIGEERKRKKENKAK